MPSEDNSSNIIVGAEREIGSKFISGALILFFAFCLATSYVIVRLAGICLEGLLPLFPKPLANNEWVSSFLLDGCSPWTGPIPQPIPLEAETTIIDTPDNSGLFITIGKCPSSSEGASDKFGGDAIYWRPEEEHPNNAWKYGPAPGSPLKNMIIPEGMSADYWDNYQWLKATGPAVALFTTEATIWCIP